MTRDIEIKIPITGRSPFQYFHHDKPMAAAIASMVGRQPECAFYGKNLIIWFKEEDFDQIKTWYGRKWRSNITHEVNRHCRMQGITPILKELTIIQAQSFQ